MKNKLLIPFIILFALCAAATGCASDDEGAEGTLRVELWGEEFIEDGIPADEFVDGFSITFDKFLINLGEITVAREGARPVIDEPEMKVWDLTKKGPFPIASVTAPAGEYDHTAYTIAGASAQSAKGNADAADVELMIDGGFSVHIAGTAADETVEKSFAWGFDTETVYDPCHSEAVLDDGGEESVQITIHGDHLFYDDAVSAEPSLRFNDIALADSDDDGEVTKTELVDYDITPLPDYGVGSLDIDNLRDFISYMTTTLGHIDGEGHCE